MADNPILNGRYRLVEQIGSGGMAVLYKAEDMDLGRTVAVKVLRPSLTSDPEFTERFRREARSAANLAHPNIVTIHDVGSDGPKTQYIVMEYVPGQNLKQLIRARGAFDVDATLSIVIEVCKGVGYAHRAGLVHCDIKPQNILVTPERRIKVVDFGIARAFTPDEDNPREDTVWGSPSYFSPEQGTGEAPGPPSDVYSIGVVLFELLTGRLPFLGNSYSELAMAHIHDIPPSIQEFQPGVPDELDRIVQQTLAKEPSQRYRTADQLGRILQTYQEQGRQPTSAFQVQQSAEEPKPAEGTPMPPPLPRRRPPQPGQSRVREPEPQGDPTMPGLPPILGRGEPRRVEPKSRASASRAPAASYSPPESDYAYDDVEDIPPVDVVSIILGIFAGALVLGLIPIWIAVFVTLGQ
jgi:serine/threonine-protein kinase